ncbi:Ribonuclease H-like superfamily [Arabidopsis thaliana x Arabidopsis arenosa]|uniref:Ribonuclease H-like superfamily n=1 Tax=Arabidopsis thaliana x Arabidopsis arenosa TaxID=1240361 RepID=A0A8T1XN64_9BRAS|nr:Ribonuclease H-like superfamily [Arabidopsis thaliana x Arabidopsis arenosa]
MEPAQASVNATYNHSKPQQKVICSHCGYTGQTVDKCYKIHGYPIGFKHKNKSAQEDKQPTTKPIVAQLALTNAASSDILAGMAKTLTKDQIQGVLAYFSAQLNNDQTSNVASIFGATITALPGMAFSSSTLHFVGALRATGNVLSYESWIIDSGATHHVCHDKNLFLTLSETLNNSVTLPTGFGVKITGIGTVKLSDFMILKNVLYIPDFRLNLLSVSQLTKDMGYRVSFDENSCMIQDHIKGLMIGKGEQISNLYILEIPSLMKNSDSSLVISANVVVDSSIWHSRLGHPSIFKTDIVTDMVETQYKTVVKAVRSDNAPEPKFVDLFKSKGIMAYHSCPETPEQNSVVERKHQHILNVARSLMFQSRISEEYWGDCVLTAVFLINRLPTSLLNNKSPHEVMTSKKPDYTGLRVFGCLCYSSTSSKNRNKFQPIANACVFLGYPSSYKGYKLLDLETHSIHISRNVHQCNEHGLTFNPPMAEQFMSDSG